MRSSVFSQRQSLLLVALSTAGLIYMLGILAPERQSLEKYWEQYAGFRMFIFVFPAVTTASCLFSIIFKKPLKVFITTSLLIHITIAFIAATWMGALDEQEVFDEKFRVASYSLLLYCIGTAWCTTLSYMLSRIRKAA